MGERQVAKRISVDETAITEILKKTIALVDDTYISLNGVSRMLSNAETQGWDDDSYVKYAEMYQQQEKRIRDTLRELEEVSIPELKGILRSINDF